MSENIRNIHLDRVAVMLSKLGGRGYCVEEEKAVYGSGFDDLDFDSDFDLDKETVGGAKSVALHSTEWYALRLEIYNESRCLQNARSD